MCVEAVAGAEVNVILDIYDADRPFLSVQTPYVFVKFTYPVHDRFSFSDSMPKCTATQPSSYGSCSRKRSRPMSEYDDDYGRPEKRRRLRLQIAFSTLSSPYSYPPSKKGIPSRPNAVARPGFQLLGKGKLPKMKGDLIRKTAILNKIRKDGLSRDQELQKNAEEKKEDILRQHRMQFENYRTDPLHNPPPSAEILEERWEADDIPRYEEDQPDEYEDFPWQFFQ
ncbi:hypothetical protein H072_3571 [Dactylellina haptotyla CBS 200.50]|uniref:Uncharacterized protein n=1 Tax=Dactylellina haptotyla (strain CBS 200.50) TaxID=1284197 RepID=S8AHY0_DACHA|nr:hypothetical protein H072_3571 [Dactylellina haptotyla CBS 200.50]